MSELKCYYEELNKRKTKARDGVTPNRIDMGFPRRNMLNEMTPAERAIYDAVQEVEKIGADVRLTEAVVLLTKARELVADFVDDNIVNG